MCVCVRGSGGGGCGRFWERIHLFNGTVFEDDDGRRRCRSFDDDLNKLLSVPFSKPVPCKLATAVL